MKKHAWIFASQSLTVALAPLLVLVMAGTLDAQSLRGW
jgi:hypothetical protein